MSRIKRRAVALPFPRKKKAEKGGRGPATVRTSLLSFMSLEKSGKAKAR